MSEASFVDKVPYDAMPYLLTEFMRKSPPWGSGRVSKSGPQNVWDQLHDAPQAEATFAGTVDYYDQIISSLQQQKAGDDMRDAMSTAWGKAATQEGSKQMEPGEYSFPMSNYKITFTNGSASTKVKDYLDPNGCHQCYVLRSKYVKLAGLSMVAITGADDVALVRCPTHEREYIAEIKKQLTEAISKIG